MYDLTYLILAHGAGKSQLWRTKAPSGQLNVACMPVGNNSRDLLMKIVLSFLKCHFLWSKKVRR